MNRSIVVIFTCFIWCLSSYAQLQAGTVYKIKTTKKKRTYVYIRGGKNEGFEKKQKVCIFNKEGEQVTCGRVVRVGKKKAQIRIRRSKADLVEKGMTVTADTGEQQAESKATESPIVFGLLYRLSPAMPASYAKLVYKAPDITATSTDTLWTKVSDTTSSLVGFGGFLTLWDWTVGLSYRFYTDEERRISFESLSELSTSGDEQRTVQLIQDGTVIDLWLDYTYLSTDFGSIKFNIASGLAVNLSSVESTGTLLVNNAATSTFLDSTSSITMGSLRQNFNFILPLGSYFLRTDFILAIPLFGEPEETASFPEDPSQTQLASGDYATDFLSSQNHVRSSFAFDLTFSTGYVF